MRNDEIYWSPGLWDAELPAPVDLEGYQAPVLTQETWFLAMHELVAWDALHPPVVVYQSDGEPGLVYQLPRQTVVTTFYCDGSPARVDVYRSRASG